MKRKRICVKDKMQDGYCYGLSEPTGKNFDLEFKPELTPIEMLELGVFGGKYMTDTTDEFPKSWFSRARLSPLRRDASLNYFGVDASQPLSVWRERDGFIRTIRAAGSSGIAATTWADGCPPKTNAKSCVGRRCVGMSLKFAGAASRETFSAALGSGKPFCIGRTTAE